MCLLKVRCHNTTAARRRIPKELHEAGSFLESGTALINMSVSLCLEFLLSNHEYLLYLMVILNIFVFIYTLHLRVRKRKAY